MNHNLSRSALAALLVGALALPAPAVAQTIDPIPPCPWWTCGSDGPVVVEEYSLDVSIDGQIATTRVTQILRNDGSSIAQGEFLHPIPADAAVTDLVLWIDGRPVDGELMGADDARTIYEDIVRRTLDPALLEYAGDGLLRLSVFPISPGDTRRVDIEYRQVLPADAGLVRFSQPLGREHGRVDIESIIARVTIEEASAVKSIYSPTHQIGVDRPSSTTAIAGFETTGNQDRDFVLYYSTDRDEVGVDVISYRDGDEGWFVLLASPGLAPPSTITAKDVALVIDTSGSMEGDKVSQAKDAARFVLDQLNDGDRFEIIAFDTGIERFSGELQPLSRVDDATEWVADLSAGGSTNIASALTAAFELEDPERPLYVIFLTDGLPTEGVVDTAGIRAALDAVGTERTSLFAFGVGYDVDSILLDLVAHDHDGTARYVLPGEEIDTAVSSLYSKLASPVLTDVELHIDGIDVSDLQPAALPDLFSGEQLVLAGRYEEPGPAVLPPLVVTLTGRIQGEPITIEYDDIRFTAAGGDDTIPTLWATRKIGELLRQIRVEGPNPETIDQIVRISIRHGIVTPYTSYLVTEDAPFGDDAIDVIAERATAAATTLGASGEAAVTAADAAADLTDSEQGLAPDPRYGDVIATAGGRTFRQVDGVWIDTTHDPGNDTVRVALASSDYFALAARSDSIAAALALGPRVIVVVEGVAHRIVGPDDEADALPTASIQPQVRETPEATPLVLGDTGDSGTDPWIPVIAVLSALGVAGALVVATGRR